MKRFIEPLSGKKLLNLLLLTGVLTIAILFLILGYNKTWRLWNIPTKLPVFYDLRLITGGAESYARGYDPAVNNPNDPEQRLFNYPRAWYLILATGIDQRATVAIGIGLVLAFFLSLTALHWDIDRTTAVILSFVVFSPAVLLAFERGNVDLAIFVFLSLALYCVDNSKLISLLILLVAVAFKLFPIFGIGLLLDKNKLSIKYIIFGLLASAAYMLFTLNDIRHIFANTLKGADLSYGVSVLSAKLSPYLGGYYGSVNRFLFVLAVLLIIGCGYLALRQKDPLELDNNLKNLSMFRLGAGIYVGTFLLGNNWDYRLMFLIFAVPQLVSWAQKNISISSMIAKISLAGVLLSCWYLEFWRLSEYGGLTGRAASFAVDELVKWILFAGLAYLLVKSLPRWLLDFPGNLKILFVQQVAGPKI